MSKRARIYLVLLAAMVSAPAAAEPLTATIVVDRGDLRSARSRSELNHRIRNVIEQVCGSYGSIESWQWPEMDSCWNSARAQVDAGIKEVLEQKLAANSN